MNRENAQKAMAWAAVLVKDLQGLLHPFESISLVHAGGDPLDAEQVLLVYISASLGADKMSIFVSRAALRYEMLLKVPMGYGDVEKLLSKLRSASGWLLTDEGAAKCGAMP